MFQTNCWYAAARDGEVSNRPMARTICNEQIVLFRKPDRTVVAMEDCCPHRMLPLSKGTVKGDRIICGYHGIEIDCEGRCVHMPNQETVRGGLDVRIYPVLEKYRHVWIWIGDPALADASKLPDFDYCWGEDWVYDGGVYRVECNYLLLVDNLMDLTHETFVHPTSIGQPELSASPMKARTEGESAILERWMLNIDPPPFWAANLGSNEKCDRWQICKFTLPANVMIEVGVAPVGTGAPEGDRSKGVNGVVFDVMTPETETSTWYFWGMTRSFKTQDHSLTEQIRNAQAMVFNEDVAVLEAQQRNIQARPERQLANFNIDVGGVYARRIVDKAIKASHT